jgi:tRNA C32,U32 (ribose-2'-O)-methylase TrmJ
MPCRLHRILAIDAHPVYPVLNLAQAVSITANELWQGQQRRQPNAEEGTGASDQGAVVQGPTHPTSSISSSQVPTGWSLPAQPLATGAEVESFLSLLSRDLQTAGFWEGDAAKQEATALSIRNLLMRVQGLTAHDLALLHGMLRKLSGRRSQRA